MTFFRTTADAFVYFVERYYPDAFVFVIALTLLSMLMALGLTDASVIDTIDAWGTGLSGLLAFIAQISITLIAAHALAHTDPVQRFLARLARAPRSPAQAYALVAATAGFASLFAWSLGLVAGGTMARHVAIEADKRALRLHYPLVVASAYAGFVVWHMGYSGSAPLFVATPDHALIDQIGIIPVTQTIFSLGNIILALLTIALISIVCPLMQPKPEEIITADSKLLAVNAERDETVTESETAALSGPADKINNARSVSFVLALLLGAYLVLWFGTRGLDLNLNIVNWSFLFLGILFARSPLHYVSLIQNASHTAGLVILQYPFYAGIMGIMATTGLGSVIAGWFISISTDVTLPFWAFLAAGLINLFVPSGGGQWAVQGPIFIEAAQQLKVAPELIVMGVAYGDQWTNMIQPFWTIPLLAIAGLDMRQIMGYSFVILLVTFFVFGGGILVMSL